MIRNAIERFDLEKFIQRFGAQPGRKGGEWRMTCPLCGRDKLRVNVERKSWHCWYCEEYKTGFDGRRIAVKGAGGTLALIQLLEGCTKEQAVKMVLGRSFAPVDFGEPEDDDYEIEYLESVRTAVKPAVPILPPEGWQTIEPSTYLQLPYLASRGITYQDVMQFGLFWCAQGKYANRIIFPVYEQNQLVYWQARAMWDSDHKRFIKALNPGPVPNMAGASEVLFNLDIARQYERVVITEGPIDAIHVGPDAVCTFGKKISIVQILKLYYAGVKAVDLMWDGPTEKEPEGTRREMLLAANKLSALFDVRLVFVPQGDPGAHSVGDNALYRSQSQNSSFLSRLARL